MGGAPIRLELLPHERAVLMRISTTPEVRTQLEAFASSDGLEVITIDPIDLHWLSSDLTHAIVKRKIDSADAFELSERLDDVDKSGDGTLENWY